jgi:hypothetical protein
VPAHVVVRASDANREAMAVDPSLIASFPPPLSAYSGEEGMGLGAVLAHRIAVEPLNLAATLLFFGAIVHTFVALQILALAYRLEHRSARDGDGRLKRHKRPLDRRRFLAEILHFVGEIEALLGLWVVPLLVAITVLHGWAAAEQFVGH